MTEELKPIEATEITQDVNIIEPTTPKYSPEAKYQWKPEDTFELTGQEYAFMYNSMVAEKAELLMKLQRIEVLEQKLIKAVESGVAVEIKSETESSKEG